MNLSQELREAADHYEEMFQQNRTYRLERDAWRKLFIAMKANEMPKDPDIYMWVHNRFLWEHSSFDSVKSAERFFKCLLDMSKDVKIT